ncbi:3-phosphoshikimate 1-carboxyvinyltransferase [Herbiconiux daphne]|uniref:3-phosphoshikimate 1-carboxyvinyltransferase n=1 Tax=Herbiconiux daphne TaxID=2970914 RepID=A0ABT2H884_9MICO|nr:3-phosphoshikimate 1-carboxyvinyltransferase [Herbiconiux daphne]MCS5736146.1 3-phosphoshikimate 1-carboxyvinyltransferase [Herbiconiux daphne]
MSGSQTPISGELNIPVSKYHAHRALVLASLAPGRSVIRGLSETRQVVWTIGVLRALGTKIEIEGDSYIVHGGRYHTRDDVVDHGSISAEGLLNVGSSGTTLYFMTGLAALADRPITLTGMKYFRRRPIKALLDALDQIGVRYTAENDCPPITVQPGEPEGGHVSIPGTLSQWLSGLLLLAPFARRETTIEVIGELNEQPYIDLTVRMMRHFGLEVEHSDDWRTFTVKPGQQATPAEYTMPPDIGSAAFGLAATAIRPSDVVFRGLTATRSADTDHPEAEFLDLVAAMGLPMEHDPETGFVRVRHDGIELAPLDIDCQPIPDLLPVLSTLATFASGTSRFRNVAHIRLKESDRVNAMLQLNKLGGDLTDTGSELLISGVDSLHGAPMSSFNDHRVLMSLAVAATRATGESRLTYPRAYRISYPTFLQAMTSVGLEMSIAAPAVEAKSQSRRALAS